MDFWEEIDSFQSFHKPQFKRIFMEIHGRQILILWL